MWRKREKKRPITCMRDSTLSCTIVGGLALGEIILTRTPSMKSLFATWTWNLWPQFFTHVSRTCRERERITQRCLRKIKQERQKTMALTRHLSHHALKVQSGAPFLYVNCLLMLLHLHDWLIPGCLQSINTHHWCSRVIQKSRGGCKFCLDFAFIILMWPKSF